MTNTTKYALIILSVSINVAFAGVWAVSVLPSWLSEKTPGADGSLDASASGAVSAPEEKPFYRRLGVEGQQWQRLRRRHLNFRKKIHDLKEDMREKRRHLFQLLRAPEPDREAIEALQADIWEQQKRIQQLVIDQILEEKKVLTPEQERALFKAMNRCVGGGAGHSMNRPGHKGPRPGRSPAR